MNKIFSNHKTHTFEIFSATHVIHILSIFDVCLPVLLLVDKWRGLATTECQTDCRSVHSSFSALLSHLWSSRIRLFLCNFKKLGIVSAFFFCKVDGNVVFHTLKNKDFQSPEINDGYLNHRIARPHTTGNASISRGKQKMSPFQV